MSKKLLFISMAVILILSSCSKPKGHLVGVYGNSKPETTPYGMVFIPRGSFMMGPNDQAVTWAMQPSQQTVSIDAFWMDQTEITNGEYLQFVHWVRDSIVRQELARTEIEYGADGDVGKYFRLVYDPYDESKDPDTILNWKTKIPWNARWTYDGDEMENSTYLAVNKVFYQGADQTSGKQLNARVMNYSYTFLNFQEAARPGNSFNAYSASYEDKATIKIDSAFWRNGKIIDTVIVKPLRTRGDLIARKIINIYPDTMIWMTEFTYSFHEPYIQCYFSHPSYVQFTVSVIH